MLQVIVNGLMTGFTYALVAVGLTLTWGVMDIINFAHGEFLLWGLYGSFWIWSLLGLDPIFSLPIMMVLIFLLGVLTYYLVIKRVLKGSGLTALLATFGLSMVLKNLTQALFTGNYRNVTNPIFGSSSFKVGDLFVIRHDYLAAAIGSVILTVLVMEFINRTKTGVSIQATSMNRNAAQLMGINTNRVYAITFGLSGACVGAAAALMASFTTINPGATAMYSTMSFVIVALGGFGSVKGAIAAGLLVGLVEALGAYFLDSSFKYAVVFLVYLVVMQVRPKGLFGW